MLYYFRCTSYIDLAKPKSVAPYFLLVFEILEPAIVTSMSSTLEPAIWSCEREKRLVKEKRKNKSLQDCSKLS